MSEMKCIVVTPEATALDVEADFVALPLYDGELGVAAHHAPMIGRLGSGELRLGSGETADRYYIDGGFVQIADNIVSVLTSHAIPAANLDATTAAEDLKAAMSRPANTPELLEIRDRAVTQARAKIRIAAK